MEKVIVKKKRHKSKHRRHSKHSSDMYQNRPFSMNTEHFTQVFGKALGLILLIAFISAILYIVTQLL